MEAIKQFSEEMKKKINEVREKRLKVYGIWVKKVVGKTEWERHYKYFDYYLLNNTLEGKPIIAFRIAKPAIDTDWQMPENCERLTDEEYLDLAMRYNLKI